MSCEHVSAYKKVGEYTTANISNACRLGTVEPSGGLYGDAKSGKKLARPRGLELMLAH